MGFRQWMTTGIVVGMLLGCAAGPGAPEPPAHLQAGRHDMIKGAEQYRRGCLTRALALFFSAHRKFSAWDQQPQVARCLNNIGNTYRSLDKAETAALFFSEARRIFQSLGDDDGEVQALCNLAAALMDLERFKGAEAALDDAVSRCADKQPAFLLRNRGVLKMKTGSDQEAETLLTAALDQTDPEDPGALAAARSALGALMQKTGRREAAVRFYRAAVEADRKAGFFKGLADGLAVLADLAKDPTEAVAYLKRSVKIYALINDREKVARIMARLDAQGEKAGADLDLVRHFVETWLEDPSGWAPCR